jgi:nitroreductase
MTRDVARRIHLAAGVLLVVGVSQAAFAQGLKPIQLPDPRKDGGRPLMQVLRDRQSQREFSSDPLPMPVLSDLLWAAFGINRTDGRRTAPSASNRQEIDVYVAKADGLYLYEAQSHSLKLIVAEDLRAATGTQPYAAEAALNLVFVVDLAKTGNPPVTEPTVNNGADVGYVSENVYLYCASEGLATVVRASIDRPMLAKRMQLRVDQRIILAQTVGYPKKK